MLSRLLLRGIAVPNLNLLRARGSPLCARGKGPGPWGHRGGGPAPANRVGGAGLLGRVDDCVSEVAELARSRSRCVDCGACAVAA